MEGGRLSGLSSQQDGGQFEDALRRLNALEIKLTDQVKVDIDELRKKWGQPRVERVTNNTFKLWQVRERLKQSKGLYVEEERLLGEFKKVKDALITAKMDDEYFEATKDTCVFLGAKLAAVRNDQLVCYSASRDLETDINKSIMTIRFEDKDFADLDIEKVRASTPLREREMTPLDRHRSMSREPSPCHFTMPPLRLSMGNVTPGGTSNTDPHAYFSRPGSSQSVYGGRVGQDKGLDEFRSKMEAAQMEDDSPPQGRRPGQPQGQTAQGIVLRDATGKVIKDDPNIFLNTERPGSAMSEMSIGIHDLSRPGSRQDLVMGDEVSNSLLDLSFSTKIDPFTSSHPTKPDDYVIRTKGDLQDDLDVEIDFGEEASTKREEEEQRAIKKASEAAAEEIRLEAQKRFEEKELIRKEEEAAQKKAEEAAKQEKIRLAKEAEAAEREERKKADEKKMADLAEKRRIAAEKEAEKAAQKKAEEEKKKEEEKQKKMEEKAKKEAEEKRKAEEKQRKEDEKKAKLEEKKRKMEEAKAKKLEEEQRKIEEEQRKIEEEKTKKLLEEEQKLEEENRAMVEAMKLEMQKFKEEAEAESADVPDTNVPTEANEATSAATKKQKVAEKKSLQKDVADLEAELQLEAAGRGETSASKTKSGQKEAGEAADAPGKTKITKKKVGATATTKAGDNEAATIEGEAQEEELLDEEARPITPKRPTSAAGKKKSADAATAASATNAGVGETVALEGEVVEEEARPITPKRPTSAAGKKKSADAATASTKAGVSESAAVEQELLDEEARPITPKRPTSAAGKKSGEATAASTKAGVSDAATLEGETVEGELLDEETRPVTPKRPTSAQARIRQERLQMHQVRQRQPQRKVVILPQIRKRN